MGYGPIDLLIIPLNTVKQILIGMQPLRVKECGLAMVYFSDKHEDQNREVPIPEPEPLNPEPELRRARGKTQSGTGSAGDAGLVQTVTEIPYPERVIAEYSYDPLGRRVSKTLPDRKASYPYAGAEDRLRNRGGPFGERATGFGVRVLSVRGRRRIGGVPNEF